MKFLKLIAVNLRRRPLRSALTIGGAACAMALLVLVESLNAGLDRALGGAQAARTLIVYRLNRYCPQTSMLPEWYGAEIEKIEGVDSVLPVKVYLNNCRASLDIVAFHGVPVDRLERSRSIELVEGDRAQFEREKDAALVGRSFADRKGLEVGDQFRFGGINVKVAGVFASDEPVEEGVVLTHLEFLQRASGVKRLGTVTQYEVKVEDASRAKAIAAEIDERFRSAPEPTDTRSRILFFESATRDLREILRFARLLGLACITVLLALVGNTMLMSVQERVREFGVFRTIGFRETHIAGLVVGESLIISLAGAALGLAAALVTIAWTHLTIASEGVPVEFSSDALLALRGLGLAALTGALAALVPAWRSSRRAIVESLRS